MPRAGLDANRVVHEAARLADEQGLDALTLARLAGRLGVRAPSLYAHVDGLADLRQRLAALGAVQLADRLSTAAAGRSGRDALRAIATAYRQYAAEHPGLYAVLQRPPALDGVGARRVAGVLLAVLRGYGLEGDPAVHAVRAVRSALHGFITLEHGGGFAISLDLEVSFETLLALLDRGLRIPPDNVVPDNGAPDNGAPDREAPAPSPDPAG